METRRTALDMAFKPRDFSDINAAFENRFTDLSWFDGELFNYFKLAQHAHSFQFTDARDKLLPKGSLGSWWVYQLKQKVKRWRGTSAGFPPRSKRNLVLESERKLLTGAGAVSPITYRILDQLENSSWWDTKGVFKQETEFSVTNLSGQVVPLDAHLRDVYADLKRVYKRVCCKESDAVFLHYFESAFVVFFEAYRQWYWLLKHAQPACVYFICHYHNEGLIAVCKILGIQIIELQHGLISRKDIYYVYPLRYSAYYGKAMFPDKLWVFGNYWKNLFHGFAEELCAQIEVVGDYRYEQLRSIPGMKKDEFVLCSQKNLHEPYIRYIQFLKNEILPKHPSWKLVVKLHPLEREFDRYVQEASSQVEILPLQAPLVDVFNRSKFQISIYSTTFFDALGFDMVNYALSDTGYSADYVEEMIQDRVALPLRTTADPIEQFLANAGTGQQLGHAEVFEPFVFPQP